MYRTFIGTTSEYRAIHYWVERRLGCPRKCNNCNSTDAKKYEWANISGGYKKEMSDWERLCTSCHIFKDNGGMCRRGLHKMVADNVYVQPKTGDRRCRSCKSHARKEYRMRYGK